MQLECTCSRDMDYCRIAVKRRQGLQSSVVRKRNGNEQQVATTLAVMQHQQRHECGTSTKSPLVVHHIRYAASK